MRADTHATLRQIDLHLRSRFRVPFTGVAAILYRNGEDFQGLHSDREMRWLDDTVIAIVVLGQRRPFVLRRRAAGGVPVERVPAGLGPRRHRADAGGGRHAGDGRGVPARVVARCAAGVDGSTAHLADVALDESPRSPRHEPDLLRRPQLQRRAAPTGLTHPLALTIWAPLTSHRAQVAEIVGAQISLSPTRGADQLNSLGLRTCPGGGIGRHGGLKPPSSARTCGFEPHPGHRVRPARRANPLRTVA